MENGTSRGKVKDDGKVRSLVESMDMLDHKFMFGL